jgi:hypothetical protein
LLAQEDHQIEVVVTPRSFSVVPGEDGVFHVTPITLSSTPGNFKIIQPIKIVSTVTHIKEHQRQTFQSNPDHNLTPRPSLPPFQFHSSTQLPRFPKEQPLSNTFEDNALVAVLGRQVANAGRPVEGFPNGLPALTPLGVRITLENMFGRDSWL